MCLIKINSSFRLTPALEKGATLPSLIFVNITCLGPNLILTLVDFDGTQSRFSMKNYYVGKELIFQSRRWFYFRADVGVTY